MAPRGAALALALATLPVLGAAAPGTAGAGEAIVAVATNFLLPLRALAADFEARTGHGARLVSGSTGQLYAQIVQGAPYDLFLSADEERPRKLEQAGRIVPGSRRPYAFGRLALWSADPARIGADGAAALRALGRGRLAIANPALAPYGAASQQTLERLGLWQPLQDRLVRGVNVAQAFQFASTGNAALSFIALSQLRARMNEAEAEAKAGGAKGAETGSAWIVPDSLHRPIRQDAVLLRRAEDNEAAAALFAFLAEPGVRRRIESFGYSAPPQ